MDRFMLLFRGGNFRGLSPELMQHHMQGWIQWMESMRSRNILLASEPLESAGKQVTGKGKMIVDGPFAESKEIVGGFSIILAENLDEALEISRGCPIFELDGTVEVRPVRDMSI